jgi:hypothetical protein
LFIGGELNIQELIREFGFQNFAALKDMAILVIGGIGLIFRSGYFEKLAIFTRDQD